MPQTAPQETQEIAPNPADVAKSYAEVAQRAARLLTQFMEKQAADKEIGAPADELGIAQPTTCRECKSTTTQRNSQPSWVLR